MGDTVGTIVGMLVGEPVVGDAELGLTVGVCDSPGLVGALVVGLSDGATVGNAVGGSVGELEVGDAVVGVTVGV